MKKLFVPMFFALGFSFACYAEDASDCECTANAEQNEVAAQSYGSSTTAPNSNTAPNNTMPPGNNNAMTPPPATCTTLPADQQNFSMQLNPGNKNMFCNTFSMDQRKQAMQMSGKMGLNGVKMTPDMSVEQIAKNNNMMPSTPAQQPGMQPQKNASGCPVH